MKKKNPTIQEKIERFNFLQQVWNKVDEVDKNTGQFLGTETEIKLTKACCEMYEIFKDLSNYGEITLGKGGFIEKVFRPQQKTLFNL